jgi:gamma-F420-2:alpha-L-glutamate ligase
MQVVIIRNPYSRLAAQKGQIERLQAEFKKKKIECRLISSQGFLAWIENGVAYSSLQNVAIIYLDKDKYLVSLLNKLGFRIFNPAEAIITCDDKMLTHIALSNQGIQMPKTIPGLLCCTKGAKLREEYLETLVKELGLPFVIKESYGSLGKQVYLVENKEEARKVLNKVKYVPHLCQELVKSSYGKDIRVIVIGGKAFAWMKRQSSTDFRSNIGLGGVGYAIQLPKAYKEVSERVASLLKLDYCGIDLLIGKDGKPLVCEVNSNAFFNEIERITKKNVARTYVEYIIKEMTRMGAYDD